MLRSVNLAFILLTFTVSSASAEQFNSHFIRGSFSALPDVFQTDAADGFYPGDYLLDIYFNKEKTGGERLTITPGQDHGLCYNKAFLTRHNIAINTTLFTRYYDAHAQCYRIQDHPDASVELDQAQQALRFNLPQSLVAHRGDALLSQWDYGTQGANLQYSYRGTHSDRQGLTQFGELGGNLNVGRWVFTGRAYKYNEESVVTPEYRLMTPIASIRAEAGIGKMQLQASLINGFAFKGVSLVSDNQMTPWLSQSYAPVISGIARTEALITVRQQGYIIYSQSVPPGPYTLRDLSGVGSGDLEVTIREEDGHESMLIYPVSVLPSLLRPGHVNYSLAAGDRESREYDLFNYVGRFAMAAADFGFEPFTLNTSLLVDRNYQNLASGITRSFGNWGAVSASGNVSSARQASGDDMRGYSLSLKYAKNLGKDTTLQFSGYRYASADYLDYTDYYPQVDKGTGIKNRLEAFITHRDDNTLYSASIWRQNDWAGNSGTGASLRFNRPLGVASITSSLNYGTQRSSTRLDYNNLSLGLSVSLPFEAFSRRAYSSTSISASRGGDYSASTNLSGALSERTRYNLSTGVSNSQANSYAALSHGFNAVNTNLSISENAGYRSVSGSLSGSLVQAGTSKPVLTRLRNDTVAVVETEGLSAAKFGREQADGNGNAVVALTPYNRNTVKIDGSNLAHDIELDNTALNLVPTRRSVHRITFGHTKINRYVLKVWLDNGRTALAPFNSLALSPSGEQLGFVTEGGILLFNSDSLAPALSLSLPEGKTCKVNTTALINTAAQIQEVVCE